MGKVNSKVLRELRQLKGWSQAELSKNTKYGSDPGINKDTISRLERGSQNNTRPSVLKKLARTFGVEIGVLTGDAPIPKSKNDQTQTPRAQIGISDQARNALYLLYDRYFIQPWQIVEMAPVLFCWAAEESLRARRHAINDVELRYKNAQEVESNISHLRPSQFDELQEKISAEIESINERDLFGLKLDDAGVANFSHGWDNPFSVFLRQLFSKHRDVIEFDGFDLLDFPDYEICSEEAKRTAGGNEELSKFVLAGHIVLGDMPTELLNSSPYEPRRIEWIRSEGEKFKAAIASISVSSKPNKKGSEK